MTERSARRHPVEGAAGGDVRDWGAHDRDRILYSEAFRRLTGVTQVAGAHEGRVFHNRMLHSLKVAQLARRMAERVLCQAETERSVADAVAALGGLSPEVAEAAALAHDLGHPPFGHVAEKCLDRLVVDAGVPDGYEGNAQSFRLLSTLSIHHEAPAGLNLAAATLRGVLKYPWRRDVDPANNKARETKRGRKWGAYAADIRDFEHAMSLAVDPGSRASEFAERSLEAEIMDWADDVTYALHDLEDFFRAGLIPLETFFFSVDERERFIEFAAPRLHPKDAETVARERCRETLLQVVGYLPTERFSGTREQMVLVAKAVRALLGSFTTALRVGEPGVPLVHISPAQRHQVDLLKQLTWHYVILRPGLATQQEGQRRVVEFLFEFYLDRLNEDEESLIPVERLVPPSLRHFLQGEERPHNARLAADIVSGLTEQEALMLYARLKGHAVGSLADRLPA